MLKRRRPLMAALLFLAVLFSALSSTGCDKQAPQQQDEPPEWVKEAHERSKKQTEARDQKPLPAPTRPGAAKARAAEAQASPIERPLLWRVDGPNGPLYLFGTIHGGIAGLEWDDFPKEARDALDASDRVILEANLDAIDQPKVGQMMLLPQGQSLKKLLGEENFAVLAKETSMPASVLERLKPWAAYAELSRKMLGEGRSVDEMIKVEARVHKKEIEYLETVEEQLQVLESSTSAEYTGEMLDDIELAKKDLATLIESYKKGDADMLGKAAFRPEYVERYPNFYEELFEKRNRAWTPTIAENIERGNVFVAVGAGHLVGDVSVIEMLQARGHKVERVPASQKADTEKAGAKEASRSATK